jgi:hypothetical protein
LLQEISDLISTFPAKTVLLSKLGCELRLNHSDILDKLQYLRLRIGTFLANHPEVFCITGERGTEQVRLLSPGEQRATSDPPLAIHNGEPPNPETSTQDEALEQVRQELKAILKKQGRPVLLSTIGTIVSPSFKNALSRTRCKLKVFARACPDFQLTNDLPGCEMIGLANDRSGSASWTPQALTQMKDMDTGEVVAGIKLQRPRKGAPRDEKQDSYRAIRDFSEEDASRRWDSRDAKGYKERQKGSRPDAYYGSAGKGYDRPSYDDDAGYGPDYYYEGTKTGFQNDWTAPFYGDGKTQSMREGRQVPPTGQVAAGRSDIYSLDNQRNGEMGVDQQLRDKAEPYRFGSVDLNMPRIMRDQEESGRPVPGQMAFASDRLNQGTFAGLGMPAPGFGVANAVPPPPPMQAAPTMDGMDAFGMSNLAGAQPALRAQPTATRSFAERRAFGFESDLGIQSFAPTPDGKPVVTPSQGLQLESTTLYSSMGPLTPVQLDLSAGPRSPPAIGGFGRTPRVGQNPGMMPPQSPPPQFYGGPMSNVGNGAGVRRDQNDSPLYYNVTQGGGIPFSQLHQRGM